MAYCWVDPCEQTSMKFVLKYYPLIRKMADYRQVSNIRRTLVGNKIVDHSDVVGASPVGAAPTTSSFSTEHLASLDWEQGWGTRTRYSYSQYSSTEFLVLVLVSSKVIVLILVLVDKYSGTRTGTSTDILWYISWSVM